MPAPSAATVVELKTPHGPARVHLQGTGDDASAVILGHGAGGGVEAPDLEVATEAAVAAGFGVALVEQPYRVAGRRSAPTAAKLDEAWVSVVDQLRADELAGKRLIVGGRSAGARVACRTAGETGAAAVLCLAFPVHPPGKPEKTRQAELDAVSVPVLVIQGESDPFGTPTGGRACKVVTVAGNHGLKKDLDAVAAAVGEWLPGVA